MANEIKGALPPYWAPEDIKIIAANNLGDAVEPNIKQRFEALVVPRHDLFVADEGSLDAYGPFIPVLPTVSAGTARIVYGIATFTYSAGTWMVELSLENNVYELGMPADLFRGPIVVRGSEEEGRLRERLRADVAERLKNQLAADLEQLKGGHRDRVRALQEELQKEIATITDVHTKKSAESKAQLAREQAEAEAAQHAQKVTNGAVLKAMRMQSQRELNDLEVAHEQAVAALKGKQEDELTQLRQDWTAAVRKAEEDLGMIQQLLAIERDKQETRTKLLEEIARSAELEEKTANEQAKAEQAQQKREAATEETRRQERARRSAAMQDAVKQKISNLETVLKGDDAHAAIAAFSDAVQSDEEAFRAAALRLAFLSKSGTIMQISVNSYRCIDPDHRGLLQRCV